MAIIESNDCSYIDIVSGENTNRHYLKDNVAREVTQHFTVIANQKYIYALVDEADHLLIGVERDTGKVVFGAGISEETRTDVEAAIHDLQISKVDKEVGFQLIDEAIANAFSIIDNPEYLSVVLDSEEKIIEATTTKEKIFNTDVTVNGEINAESIVFSDEIINALVSTMKANGESFTTPVDWSEASELAIPMPRCAVVNITGVEDWPTSKFVDEHAWLHFWDCNGNYFKKRIIFNAQGNSSLAFEKKNGAFDICNDEWEGDDTFSLKIGNWIEQDSFHLKAYYTDFFRGVAVVTYQLMDEIVRNRGLEKDRPWKKALFDYSSENLIGDSFEGINDLSIELDTGARNFPDGFPCKVYLNGKFYGLYSWQLKKHRDNFHMKKDNPKHIWLDGLISDESVLAKNGDIVWTNLFEVRNPKNLYLMDGTEYDADFNYGELMDETSEFYDLETDSEKVKKRKQTTAQVKEYIKNLSIFTKDLIDADNAYIANPTELNSQAVKDLFETHFDIENLIDYQIISDVVRNSDGFRKNWQWATYDGIKWWICIYDVDMSFGGHFDGNQITLPLTAHLGDVNSKPSYYIIKYYTNELEARYSELRKAGIIDAEKIVQMLNDWCNRFGFNAYKKEFDKWPNCPCHGESVLNEGWEIVPGQMGTGNTFDIDNSYVENDTCTYGISSAMGYYTFKATMPRRGIPPVKTWKYADTIYRVKKWLVTSIQNMDNLYNYNGGN